MSWLTKMLRRERRKSSETVLEGGLELLTRLTGDKDIGRQAMMEKYGKSVYIYACVSKIAEKLAGVPLKLNRIINSKGEMKEIQAHPLLDLLYKPNPFQTKSEFWELTVMNLKLVGDAFWLKVRNTRGAVVEMWNLRPDKMTVVADELKYVKAYKLTKNDGKIITFDPADIVHFKSPDPLNEHYGMSALKPAQMRIETEANAVQYQRDFFLNSARPDAVIKSPEANLDKEQKDDIREGWEKRHRGVGKSSKIAILEGGLEYQVISLSQKDMDYIEGMKFTRDDILVAMKTPKVVVSIVEDVNRANAETGMAIFLSENVKPLVERIVEKVNWEMTYPDFGEEMEVTYVDPTPADREMAMKEYDNGLKNNYLLINEVRAKEGLPPIAGGWSMYMTIVNQAVGGLAQNSKTLGGDTEAEAYVGGKPDRTKLYDFKGRYWLKVKLEMREKVAQARREQKRKKKGWKPMILNPEIKKAYAEMILKGIDARTDTFKPVVARYAEEQCRRVKDAIEAKAKAVTVKVKQIFDMEAENGALIDLAIPQLAAYLEQAGKDALSMTAPAEDFQTTKKIKELIRKRAEFLAESVNNTTVQGLEATLADGIAAKEGISELKARVDAEYSRFPSWRTELIARTEATAANNEGMIEGFRQSGVANGKEWINAGDDRVRPEHQDGVGVGGEIVALNATFSNGLGFPQEPNCRCVLGPAFLEQ